MARTVMIIYEHFTPSVAHASKSCWSGIFKDTREGYDYGTKEYLKRECLKDGFNFEVYRSHRNGSRTIIERGWVLEKDRNKN